MEQIKENKMGTQPIPKLLISMSLPMIASMLVQALYNVVDSIFVARISESALTAVSLAFPVQNLMIAVAAGTGVGVNALLSRSLGSHEYDKAEKIANTSVFLAFISYIVCALLGIFFSEFYFTVQTDNAQIARYGHDYLAICMILSIGLFGQICFERLLQSTGRTLCIMFSQGTGAIINIIFDYLLIFGIGPFPKLGIAGAAYATVGGQIIAFIIAVIFNLKVNKEITLRFRYMRLYKGLTKQIYAIGVPGILMVSIGSVMTFCLNKIFLGFAVGTTAVAVFGAYFKLQSFAFMPVFGLNNGMVPIIAFNYGARNKKRIMQTMKLSMGIAIGIMLVALVLFQSIPKTLLRMFNASPDMMSIGVIALRTISISYLFAGFCIISSSVFQALGDGMKSLLVSFARQIVVLIPVAYLFSLSGNINLVWWSFPIAELMSLLVCILSLKKIMKTKLSAMK